MQKEDHIILRQFPEVIREINSHMFVLSKPFISRGFLFRIGLLEKKIYFQITLKIKGSLSKHRFKKKKKKSPAAGREGSNGCPEIAPMKACTFGAYRGQLSVLKLQKSVDIFAFEATDVLRGTGQGGGSSQTFFKSYFFP